MNSKFTNRNRRQFIRGGLTLGAGFGFQSLLPAWAQSGRDTVFLPGTVVGSEPTLIIDQEKSPVAGKTARHITINGQFPAPLLRWREGDVQVIRVVNNLDEDTSIHWHGILLPFQMDGVPGTSFPGIAPGEVFTYRFPIKQAGTYWYHSHSGFQEQLGHYGPVVIDPAGEDPVQYDREYIVLLSDWTFENPRRVFAKLKKMSDTYNFQQRTVSDFFREVEEQGFDRVMANRMMWGDMRMNPTDLSDVTGATYTYLVNGHSPEENWTGLFQPGENVRLRFINASAMSIFNIRIPGLPMNVVQADGLNVQPVEVDEFQIGTAETFDVIVHPDQNQAYTVMCETNDRSGYAAATLAPRQGMRGEVPPLRPRPILTMKDMGMSGMDMNMDGMDKGVGMDSKEVDARESMPMSDRDQNMAMAKSNDSMVMDHAAMGHDSMNHEEMRHEEMEPESMEHTEMHQQHMMLINEGMESEMEMSMDMTEGQSMQAHNHPRGPGVVSMAMNPVNRLHERPLGLEDEPHRVLVYTDLKSLETNPDARSPERELELHLTSNMERYMWSFDGKKFSEVKGPVVFHKGERLRLTLVNDTMMPHPLHLHGMFFDVVTGDHKNKPRKHTIVVKPGEKMAIDITADAPGDWAFHCHLFYHMKAGMMRVVSVRDELT